MTTAVLDHVAIGGRELTDGWELFGALLGGSWVYGGDVGFWWGQLGFAAGPKIELITPTASPGSAFLERFLAARGSGPHHVNFIVPDITETLTRIRATGVEPVGVRLDHPNWKEAFLHPKDAFGIVIQVAQQDGKPPALLPPAELSLPGPSCEFALVEHYVGDLAAAITLFRDVLDGALVREHDLTGAGHAAAAADGRPVAAAELTWPNGARLRLIEEARTYEAGERGGLGRPSAQSAEAATGRPSPREADRSGRLGALCFVRSNGAAFTPADRQRAARLAANLGIPLEIGSRSAG
jgi:methylmalonyl-CoA/ethylmalonyl-CoA epimerase